MTARTGMTDIISDLRGLTEAGVSDYSIVGSAGTAVYWSDDQLQIILDNRRTDLKWYEMTAIEEGDGSYLEYSIDYGNLEATSGGTAIFIVQDLNGEAISSSLYSVDYRRGVVTFNQDTAGTAYWVTGRSYDLSGAAADVWRRKMSHYHTAFNFSTDGHRVDREQLYKHAMEMAEYFELQGGGGFGTIEIMRSDTDA
jgi:hypothetical protein